MRWEHACSLGWLKERRYHLTASDIKKLVPFTKSGNPKKITYDDFLKVHSKKLVILDHDDCISYGAAARGHILEPYAIKEFNKHRHSMFMPNLSHWEDCILVDNKDPMLGFSPDAMDIAQTSNDVILDIGAMEKPRFIGEIKCYAIEKHLVCGCADKEDLEERWQIATAMAVCDSIERGALIFYHPGSKIKMFVVDYRREDLEDEIEIIRDIKNQWMLYLYEPIKTENKWFAGSGYDEKEIYMEYLKDRDILNPV